jgi:hypothetical protein
VTATAGAPPVHPVPWARIAALAGFIVLLVLAVVLVLMGAFRLSRPVDATTTPGLPIRVDDHEVVVTGQLAEGTPRPIVTEHCRSAVGTDMPGDVLLAEVLILSIDGAVVCRGERGVVVLAGTRVTVREIDAGTASDGGPVHRIEVGPAPRRVDFVTASIPGVVLGAIAAGIYDMVARALRT